MIAQGALNVVARVDPARRAELDALLARMKADPGNNPLLPFARLPAVHFARIALLPASVDGPTVVDPALLVFSTDFDGPRGAHVGHLLRDLGRGLDALFTHCEGYPALDRADESSRREFIEAHSVPVQAHYVNTVGRTVEQIRGERRLREALEEFLDGRDWTGRSPVEVRRAILDYVRENPELSWALAPPPRRGFWRRGAVLALLIAAAVAGLALLARFPLAALGGLGAFLVLLRFSEVCNRPDNRRPLNGHVANLELDEDRAEKNQLSSVGSVQRGGFRAALVRLNLALLDLGGRAFFDRGQLSGVVTIHFARWVLIDGGRRLYFMSNYDGSPDSYQDDFIERVAFGLNLVFSNGRGWPPTRYLLFGGAREEQALKAYYRDHQIPTQLWFSSPVYDGLTAVNIANNARLRAGLAANLGVRETAAWLQLL